MSGMVIWFVGLPASGKSTLAQRFRARLVARNTPVIVLDGDVIRTVLGANDYAEANRDELYRILADLAATFAAQDVVVLVAATAPKRAYRTYARSLGVPFVEVWVRASLSECRARDYKGLYAAADRGEIETLPGVSTELEPPLAPEVSATGGFDDTALDRLDQLVPARA
jgi:adenylylsulfate kinase-like enzyme